jgi:hypothetical protein
MSQSDANAACRQELEKALTEQLTAMARSGPTWPARLPTPSSPEGMAELYVRNDPPYGIAGLALLLPDPNAAKPQLNAMLEHKNLLVAIEAAATLAVLGDDAGVPVLLRTTVQSNSEVEFFFARAALTLLRRPLPPSLQKQRSVFGQLEAMVDRCQQTK